MRTVLRVTWPVVVGLLAYCGWAVLTKELTVDLWILLTVLALTAIWIVPSSVVLDREYRAGTVQRLDSFCFKLTCYTFGTPLIVIWVNTMLFYTSEL